MSPSQLIIENGINVYGNDVILRSTYVQGGGQKSYILYQRPLSQGALAEFFVFVHSVEPGRASDATVELKLQVWREVSEATYRLLYERIVDVNHSTRTGVYYVVSSSAR